MRLFVLAVLLVVLLLRFVCGVFRSTVYPPTSCDPLVPDFCTFPFPNNYWLLFDSNASDAHPLHLALSESNFPTSVNGDKILPENWNRMNGFAPLPGILAYWPELSINNCAPLWNISQSVAEGEENTSPIIILETETNTRIPYWVELDHASDNRLTGNEANRTLMIWPARRLHDGYTYIVAIRNLQHVNGSLVLPSIAFKDLRDNLTSNDEAVNVRRPEYNDFIFPALEANSIQRKTLQLAWVFTVMSTQQQTATMLAMRNDAFSRIDWDDGGVEYRISDVIENPWSNVARKINGFMSVPWYLNSRLPGTHVRIVRDSNNYLVPVYQSMVDVEFEILIPVSVANGSKIGRWLEYGHGLFYNFHEIESGFMRAAANEYGYISGGVNLLGMCEQDVLAITEILTFNLSNFIEVPDRLHQGMLNELFLMKLMLSSKFQNDNIFVFPNVGKVINEPYYRYYYGNSQGGIMGVVYMALSTDVTHGVLGEPGMPYSLLLFRSVDFQIFENDIKVRYRSDTDRVLLMALIELLWVTLEPSGYSSHLNIKENLFDDNTPLKSVLIHYSLGDAQVCWLGAQILARTLDCYMYESQVPEYNETLWGYQFLSDNITVDTSVGSIDYGKCLLQGWNYNVPQVPFVNLPPPKEYDTHDKTKDQADAQFANWLFFKKGIIENTCKGPCNAPF